MNFINSKFREYGADASLLYTTPTKAAVIYGMEPVSSAFFSYFIGAELLTLRQYTGAMIIIFAMIFVEAGSYYRSKSINS